MYGRLRLTLALTRVTLEIPMVLDRAMRDELPAPVPARAPRTHSHRDETSGSPPQTTQDQDGQAGTGQLERRGLLGVKTRGMLVLTCKMLERAEHWAGPVSSPSPTVR